MGLLNRFRAWIWRTEEASNKLEYGALDALHHAEDRVDEATHGRFYDTLEKADEEAGELLDRVGLSEDEPSVGDEQQITRAPPPSASDPPHPDR
jgi:hypothetical protein